MTTLAVIPARGGSKRIPRKNIALLFGRPLIDYTITAALKSKLIDKTIVSTEDSEIASISLDLGAEVLSRPNWLASDCSLSIDVIKNVVENVSEDNQLVPDTIILLQPTSPFRTSIHIKEALKLYSSSLDMVVSVKLSKTNPYFNLFEETEEGYLRKSKEAKATRRQDVPQITLFRFFK